MGELTENRPTDLKDFSRGFYEAAKLYRENPDTRSGSGFGVVAGLIALFPEKINFESLNRSPLFHRINATAHVATLVNDYLDMQTYLDTPEGKGLKKKIEDEWKKTLEGIQFEGELPKDTRGIIKSYMAGITLLDDSERSNPDNSLTGIIRSKELENAISLVHCAAIIMGDQEIGADCLNLYEEVSAEQVREKYSWILKGEPENETQKRLCAIFNVIMLTQTIDDQFDVKIDNKLSVRNIYSAILIENKNDQQLSQKRLEEIQKQYYATANKFGISNLAYYGNKVFMKFVKMAQYKYPQKLGGYRERLIR